MAPPTSHPSKLSHWLLLLGLALVCFSGGSSGVAAAGTIIKTLPGFSGELPFSLETGYVSVNDSELFYYFVESEGDPVKDPLLIYLIGGPSCSALNGLFLQVGPLAFNTTEYPGGLPSLEYYPNGWTQTASIIFLDIPVGSGFSYATTQAGYYGSDLKSCAQIIAFLRKWLIDHPKFLTKQFYVASDSYSGAIAPVIAQEIINANDAGVLPYINLKGIISGCAHTDSTIEDNAVYPYAYRMALVSKPLFDAAQDNCYGNYTDPPNADCELYVNAIEQCIEEISTDNILEPYCATVSPKPNETSRRSLPARDKSKKSILSLIARQDYWCRNFVYELLSNWANDKGVQTALNIREGTIERWVRCNLTLLNDAYTYDVSSGLPYQRNLTHSGLQLFFYSGDHDMVVPHIATEAWITSLNLTTETEWRPWFFNGQVAGYTVQYTNLGYRLTYATVKGSGHSPTEWMREECSEMFSRWIHHWPL